MIPMGKETKGTNQKSEYTNFTILKRGKKQGQIAIEFTFTSDWLRERPEISGSITGLSKANWYNIWLLSTLNWKLIY